MGPIDTNQALVEIRAWRRIGDKPLSEPMLIRFTDANVPPLGGDELNARRFLLKGELKAICVMMRQFVCFYDIFLSPGE